jgi:hypothetical protein
VNRQEVDGKEGTGNQQASYYLGSFLELKGKDIKTDGNPNEDLGNKKIGHQAGL